MNRVLHIVGGMNRAGAETMIMNIYRALDKTKFQFDFLVYTDEKQDYEDEIVSMGGRVIHMPITAGGLSVLKSVGTMRRIIKRYGPYCAIHAATLHNSAFALIATVGVKHCKRIVHSHNTSNVLDASLPLRVYNYVTKLVIQALGDEYIACGEEAGNYLFGKKLFRKKGVVLNNSVDYTAFYRVSESDVNKVKAELGISDELVIGSVARFCEVKNHDRMLAIASELRREGIKFKLLLIGRGDLENAIQAKAIMMGLEDEVIFLGVRSDVARLMHVMHVFLMPSFFEGNPVTLIEAQASCLPAVISDNITPKIDLGLGLIARVPLDAPNSEWVKRIVGRPRRKIEESEVEQALIKSGYDLMTNVDMLCDLYLR